MTRRWRWSLTATMAITAETANTRQIADYARIGAWPTGSRVARRSFLLGIGWRSDGCHSRQLADGLAESRVLPSVGAGLPGFWRVSVMLARVPAVASACRAVRG